jgi:hypothetical protein
MTRREYRDMAYIFHLCREDFKSPKKMRDFVETICNWLQGESDRFDRTLFIEAVYDPEFWDHKPETTMKQQRFLEGA